MSKEDFKEKNKELLDRAIRHWGAYLQIDKLQEECLELSLAVSNWRCITKDSEIKRRELIDELADVKIMIAQMEMIFGEAVNDRANIKLGVLNKILDDNGG